VATTDLTGVESDAEARDRIARIEQRMLDAEAVRSAAAAPVREAKTVAYPSYEAALAAGKRIGARRADDAALMALFCEGPLQTLVGAVSPELVWDGAQRRGLTTRELGTLANSDVMAVSDLQWDDEPPTAPLPAPAAEALARLELRLRAPEVLPAVARYEIASFRTAQLSDWLYRYGLSDADFQSLEFAQDVMRESYAVLAAAGRLDLIGGAV